ncbi:RNA-binding protein NOB1 [Leptinotarsa decemlineata]|uniref:RNA-binding protein NOB1 n=1 Tax=Leptinotarsa decemlineata TaxID=7539 RepID=UPI000C253585|nr:RNA-binding protein NOB1 [Leptinotarsa decemlineata]
MGPEKHVGCLVVDTTAFIQNAQLQNVAETIITCPEVVAEIKNKRQLKRLVVLPYDLIVKEAFPENIHVVSEFAKKTGDYPSLSATDIKVMALTYQLEKEKVGTDHIRLVPLMRKAEITTENKPADISSNEPGFYLPSKTKKNQTENDVEEESKEQQTGESELIEDNTEVKQDITIEKQSPTEDHGSESDEYETASESDEHDSLADVLVPVLSNYEEESEESDEEDDEDDGTGWITPSNIKQFKKTSELAVEKKVEVACMTTDFAMQNVLRQMNLNVSALDGRLIKHLRTYILRCYACFKTTSVMTKKFCPKCGNDTLKKVAVSLDENGKLQIHINAKRPLTARGKKFSLPRIRGGKHPNNPILVEDQPMPHNMPSRLARMKNNPMEEDYVAGVSPFVMRDISSKSAQLCIRPGQEFKYWMRKNPNEARRKRK